MAPLERGHNEDGKEEGASSCCAKGQVQRTPSVASREGDRSSPVGCNNFAAELCHVREPGEPGSEDLARSQVWVPLDPVRPASGSQHQRSGGRRHLVDGSVKA